MGCGASHHNNEVEEKLERDRERREQKRREKQAAREKYERNSEDTEEDVTPTETLTGENSKEFSMRSRQSIGYQTSERPLVWALKRKAMVAKHHLTMNEEEWYEYDPTTVPVKEVDESKKRIVEIYVTDFVKESLNELVFGNGYVMTSLHHQQQQQHLGGTPTKQLSSGEQPASPVSQNPPSHAASFNSQGQNPARTQRVGSGLLESTSSLQEHLKKSPTTPRNGATDTTSNVGSLVASQLGVNPALAGSRSSKPTSPGIDEALMSNNTAGEGLPDFSELLDVPRVKRLMLRYQAKKGYVGSNDSAFGQSMSESASVSHHIADYRSSTSGQNGLTTGNSFDVSSTNNNQSGGTRQRTYSSISHHSNHDSVVDPSRLSPQAPPSPKNNSGSSANNGLTATHHTPINNSGSDNGSNHNNPKVEKIDQLLFRFCHEDAKIGLGMDSSYNGVLSSPGLMSDTDSDLGANHSGGQGSHANNIGVGFRAMGGVGENDGNNKNNHNPHDQSGLNVEDLEGNGESNSMSMGLVPMLSISHADMGTEDGDGPEYPMSGGLSPMHGPLTVEEKRAFGADVEPPSIVIDEGTIPPSKQPTAPQSESSGQQQQQMSSSRNNTTHIVPDLSRRKVSMDGPPPEGGVDDQAPICTILPLESTTTMGLGSATENPHRENSTGSIASSSPAIVNLSSGALSFFQQSVKNVNMTYQETLLAPFEPPLSLRWIVEGLTRRQQQDEIFYGCLKEYSKVGGSLGMMEWE